MSGAEVQSQYFLLFLREKSFALPPPPIFADVPVEFLQKLSNLLWKKAAFSRKRHTFLYKNAARVKNGLSLRGLRITFLKKT